MPSLVFISHNKSKLPTLPRTVAADHANSLLIQGPLGSLGWPDVPCFPFSHVDGLGICLAKLSYWSMRRLAVKLKSMCSDEYTFSNIHGFDVQLGDHLAVLVFFTRLLSGRKEGWLRKIFYVSKTSRA